MKLPTTSSLSLAVLAGISLVTPALAVVNIDYVSIGHAGNAADPADGDNNTAGVQNLGAVAYAYKIGQYEVTNAQYGEFLNAKGASNSNGIYSAGMASYGITQSGSSGSFSYNVTSGFENKPVVYVSWYDAARFTNWLGNGQGGGDMETGAYNLMDATTGIISVNPGAKAWLPTESEWYKAAYYQGNGTYSLYPNGQNSITTADANYNGSASTDVGAYAGDASFYGTFDQGGNAWEWNDAVIGSSRGLRGGSWFDAWGDGIGLRSSFRISFDPSVEYNFVGFRVASVPEPSALVLTILFSAGLVCRRKR